MQAVYAGIIDVSESLLFVFFHFAHGWIGGVSGVHLFLLFVIFELSFVSSRLGQIIFIYEYVRTVQHLRLLS